ncbi:MAG: hypothetical protein K6G79_00100 [Bacteroidales bacterium]|nr:hypothetical protein [Bacteroidales bacterium]
MYDREKLIGDIRAEVEDRRAYLDPGLTIASLADRIGSNRTYTSGALMALGGFNNYIGRLRLSHFTAWRIEHPGDSIEKCARASGFRSRQTYYNLKNRS